MKDRLAWTFPGCPTAPAYDPPDWSALGAQFSWLRAMDGVPQEPRYHAEGNVLVHTRMVAEALRNLCLWREEAPEDREALFGSALLHDAGKPASTVREPDGRITAHGHAKKSEKIARRLLWTGEELPAPAPFRLREQIAGLVRWHGLPLQFLNKADPVRAVIEASQRVRLDHLALLAEADVRGRICADQQELLDCIEMFRELCREQACEKNPSAFPDAYSRFVYLRNERGDPHYEAYNDTVCTVIVMAGLPGVGKDTWIQAHLSGWPVVSLDSIRRELRISPQDEQGRVVQVARERARELMREQRSFVWNATSITRFTRQNIIDLALAYHACTRIVYLDAPFATILSRNRERQAGVPEDILYRLLDRLEMPDVSEAHEVEWIEV